MAMSQRVFDRVVSVLCLAGIITALIYLDSRVRDRFFWLVDEASRSDGISSNAGSMADAIIRVAHDHSLAHAPLLIFAFVGVVLVCFMFKT
jgi:hypothetical protein